MEVEKKLGKGWKDRKKEEKWQEEKRGQVRERWII